MQRTLLDAALRDGGFPRLSFGAASFSAERFIGTSRFLLIVVSARQL